MGKGAMNMTESVQVQTGFAEVNGTRLYYEVAGNGHPFTLVHGGLVDRRMWDDQFEEFARHFKVIRYDMRGFGDSGLMKTADMPFSLEKDLHDLLQFLSIEKTYIMGLSMGGALATNFTLLYPEMVDALITVGAGLGGFEHGKTDEAEELKKIDAAMEEAYNNHDIPLAVELSLRFWTDGPYRKPDQVDPAVRERVKAMTARNWERPNDEDAEPQDIDPKAIGRLSEIHVPTLVIVGDKDNAEMVAIANTLTKGIAGAKRASIANAAHHPNMERPKQFNQIVLDFLESLA
jgi:3-oxoadipate enol-lactonase